MKGIQNTSTNNFSSIIGNNKKFVVPKFQRDYSWDSEQWDDLWLDIENMILENDDHYMGYLVLQTTDDKLYKIIDGQQRFTTVTILVLAAISAIRRFVEKGIEVEDNIKRMENLLQTYIGKVDPVSLDYDNILVLNRNNDAYFRDYIVKLDTRRVRNLKASEKLMKKCFDFFEQRMRGKYKSGRDYAQYVQTVVDNLYFTQIVVSDDMNAFRVFETLNARGVQLSSSDLLKNYLFSLVDKTNCHSSRIESLENKWAQLTDNIKTERLSEFLRYYWNSGHKSIRANALFKTIRNYVKDDKQVFSILNEMLRYSDVYMALTDRNDELWTDNDLSYLVGLLNLFKLKQPYPLLMTAYLNLDRAEFKRLFKYIITLCFRYNVICDRNPNDQEAPFNALAMYITGNHKVDYSLLSPLLIEDNAFVNSFSDKSFPYSSRNAKIIRYILGRIERHEGSTQDVRFDDEDATIEHILPQNPDAEWNIDDDKVRLYSSRLGNMCLLEKSLNRSVKSLAYSEKLSQYAKSAYVSASKLAENYPTWDENTIKRRQQKMANMALGEWKVK